MSWDIERDENGQPAKLVWGRAPILPAPMGDVYPVRKVTRAELARDFGPPPEQLEIPDQPEVKP